ncbi:glycoside hydrolase [Kalaharituber pfeilii]|nr:glycoside hydrolase [Kalaharituber pfeilii]
MNSLRDPFAIRSKPPLAILIQKAASASSEAASRIPTFETIAENTQAKIESLAESGARLAESMAFTIPKNVPSFDSPNRERENQIWSAVTGKAHSPTSVHSRGGGSIGLGSITGSSGGGFFKDKELPMYKDKPYYYTGSYRRRRIWKQRRFWGFMLLVIGVLYWLGMFSRDDQEGGIKKLQYLKGGKWFSKTGEEEAVNWDQRREKVKEAFIVSWEGYEKHAWGYDEWHPISKTKRQMAPQGLGWIIIDSLDTMMIMNLTTQLSHAKQWISQSLTWDQDQDVNTFETTIRMLGGLLSAHYLQNDLKMVPASDDDDLFLEKATDLAERLLGAFDSTSGIPFASVNLKTNAGIPSHTDGGASSTAEAATLQLEMKYLSILTGELDYWRKAEKAIQVIDNNGAKDGLVPIFINAASGEFHGSEIRLGSRGDSYYEYLLKQYLQTNKQEPTYLGIYNEAMSGVKTHLWRHSLPSHFSFIAELPTGVGGTISPKMDHLVCFLAGNLALGATEGKAIDVARKEDGGSKWSTRQEEDLRLARELTRTCYEMYNVTKTGLAPEIAYFNIKEGEGASGSQDDIIIKPRDAHNLQRPETVESLFIMWRLTKEEIYREWGWNIFKSFMEHSAVADGTGFTSLDDVTVVPSPQRDNMESFWLAETLKYLYLLFSPDDLLPLDQIVFNTEAHPFPKFDIPELFKGKVGWERLPRNEKGEVIKSAKSK